MVYEWDDAKCRRNLDKHGLDFSSLKAFDWRAAKVAPDVRHDYGEDRFVAYGPL